MASLSVGRPDIRYLLLVWVLMFVVGCGSESTSWVPALLAEAALRAGPTLDSPYVIRVCVKQPGVPRHKSFWAVDGAGRLVLDDSELALFQQSGQPIYCFDEDAKPDSARMLPIPHNTLQCTEPTPSVLASNGHRSQAKRALQPAVTAKPAALPAAAQTPPPCEDVTEPGQKRSRGTTTRTCVRPRTLRAPTQQPPTPLAQAKPGQRESPTRAQAAPTPTSPALTDWNVGAAVLGTPILPSVDPQRLMECVGSLCHARHPNFAKNGGKPAASGALESRALSTGKGGGAKAPTTRKPPSGPKPAATAKPAQAGTAVKPKANEAPYGQKKDGTPKKKPGPKTSDTDPHNAKVIEVRKKLEAEGNTVINGGRKPGSKEEVVPTPGGHKESRRPDHTYLTPDGKKRGINVGKTKADGTPVKREQEALDDLNKHSNRPTDFVPYDR